VSGALDRSLSSGFLPWRLCGDFGHPASAMKTAVGR
jgi:hypothetical protein